MNPEGERTLVEGSVSMEGMRMQIGTGAIVSPEVTNRDKPQAPMASTRVRPGRVKLGGGMVA